MGALRGREPAAPPVEQDGATPAVRLLAVRLLGPLEVRVAGERIGPLRTRKDAWLLALLLLRHDREVDRTWLCSALWPESAPEDAAYNLRRSLACVRHALGLAAGHIHTPTPHSLRLETEGALVDLLQFDAAINRGDTDSLETAVSLYKGSLLEGCLEEWVLPEREARERAYREALAALAAHALSQGDPQAAVARLRREVAVDPLCESAQRRLMQALASAGEYAAVKRAYLDLRQLLRQELNADPDRETTALWERVQELQRRRLGVPCGSAPTGSLPGPLNSLVGRETELREVSARLSTARLLTLTGPGGIGKTRLAIRAAEDRIPCHNGGVWFVELAPLEDGALLPHVVAATLQIRDRSTRATIDTLVHELKERSVLVVLDNCEHLLDSCAELANALLRECRRVRILATSREPLGVAGEVIVRVPPLSLPAVQETMRAEDLVASLSGYDAVRLFTERASLTRTGIQVNETNIGDVVRICQQLDGNPLAIELAAARLKVLSIQQIASRLDERFHLLTGGARSLLPRQRTLRATMDWSYDLLRAAERVLLRRLSVFTGGCTLDAVEAVCADDDSLPGMDADTPIPAHAVLDLLSHLTDKSLVEAEERAGAVRYRLLETVRQYAADRLQDAGSHERDDVLSRYRGYFIGLAENPVRRVPGEEQAAWVVWAAADLDNLRALLGWSLGTNAEFGLRLVTALNAFWTLRDRLGEALHWVNRLLERAGSVHPPIRAWALWHAGIWTKIQGDPDGARAFLGQALAISRESGDPHSTAAALTEIAILHCQEGEFRKALPMLEESVRLHREIGEVTSSLCSRMQMGIAYRHLAEEPKCQEILEECLALARAEGDRHAMILALDYLGDAAADRGDYPSAGAHHGEKLALAGSTGDHNQVVQALNDLARVAWLSGDTLTARAHQDEALAVARGSCSAFVAAPCINIIAQLAFEQGDLLRMETLSRESLELAFSAQLMERVAEALRQLAAAAVGRGAAKRGTRLLGVADRLQERSGPPRSFGAPDLLARTLAAAHRALDDREFDAAWREGRSLTVDQAVDYALQTGWDTSA